jgi:O-antigen/teichoic acid export membrane protein
MRYISMQAGTLAVGSVAGPATAGGFRLADRIATATTKPSEQLARVIYPELAHLVASNDRELLRRLLVRSALISLIFAAVVVGLCVGAGGLILRVIAGPQFTFAQPFLAILAVAAAIELSGFVLEPWHNAHGGAAIVLRARLAGAAIYALLLIILLPLTGAIGAAIAAVASSAVLVGVLALAALRMLSGTER